VIASGFRTETRALPQAMKRFGTIMADNGSNWHVTGAPDDRWDNDALSRELSQTLEPPSGT
jgi:hypothetical protein